MIVYGALETAALGLRAAADVADAASHLASQLAKGATKAAEIAAKLADVAENTAQSLAATAAQEEAAAEHDDAVLAKLTSQYASQVKRKLAKIAHQVGRVIKKVAKKAGHIAATVGKAVGKAAYKYSGAQDVVSCVTHPKLSSCVKAAVTVALVVGTAGEGEVAEVGLNAAEHVGEDVAEEGVGTAVGDAGESCVLGGESFTAGTKVLLASGKAVPISSLKPGQKVVSTSTKTGKNQTGTVAAVLVHHDTNRYDLTVRAHGRTAVIHTTSNHPFWDVTTHRWVKAGALRYGTHLRTSVGGTATVLGGNMPQDRSGWMWDLTIPGDHDFYIDTIAAPVLVHNCSDPGEITGYTRHGLNQAISRDGVGVSPAAINDAVRNPINVVDQANGTIRYIGRDATVALNQAGKVVTTWARNSAGRRIVP